MEERHGYKGMIASQIGIIIFLVVELAVFVAVFYAVYRIIKGIRSFARQAFGTDSLKEGFNKVEQEYASTPKSVSAMTSLHLPKIKKDFPEFQYDEMKVRAQNVLTSYLMAITEKNPGRLTEGSRELKDKLEMYISQQKNREEKERFEDVKLHRTEIADYRKQNGRCIITFQSSLQYRHSLTGPDGRLLQGNPDVLKQARYNTDVVYIQDRNLVEDERDWSLGINCPNCGAPVSGLGSKVCEYCGTPVKEINIYAWTFHDVRET